MIEIPLALLHGVTAPGSDALPFVGTLPRHELVAASRSEQWRKLLHYVQPGLGIGPEASDVISTDFFLSGDGRNDTYAELVATIDAMHAPVGDNPDHHAQCRFPGRYIWLKRSGLTDEGLADVACGEYRKWLGFEKVTGASLVFVSGHLENPSSFYGHLMLRLNTEFAGRNDPNQLLGRALNHGAVYPDNENGIAYIFNGLTGGYPATFSEMSYFNHGHEWNEEELRDAWEYELDLTDEQLELLLAHTWEMKSTFVPYFFMKQNCGYRIAEMVSVVLEGTLLPDDKPWSTPVDVLDTASQFQNGDRPLIRQTRLLASRQTVFRERYRELAASEKDMVRAFIARPPQSVDQAIAGLSIDRQSAVLETLLDYYNMDQSRGGQTPESRDIRNRLIVARMQRPSGATHVDLARADPNEGNKTSLFEVTVGNHSEFGATAQVRLRGAYNDFLTRSPGSLAYSELTLGDIRVDANEAGLYLRSAEILRITTLSLSETGLPDDGGMAWRLRFGIEQDSLECDDCLVGYVEGGAGVAGELGGGFVAYGLAAGRAAAPARRDGVVQAGGLVGLITDPSKPLRAAVEVGAWHDLDGDGETRTYAQLEARYGTSPNWDFTLTARQEHRAGGHALEARAGIVYYW